MSESGKWAVITGATSGIGKALVFEFAAGGFNIFLTGRNEAALAEVAAACSDKYNVETDTLAADLSRLDSIDKLIRVVLSKPRHYDVLVNNAGFGIHGSFVSNDIEQDIQLLNVQLAATLRLTKALLPSMVSRRRGNILNIASVYSFAPVPFQSIYSACKAFLLSFSSSLHSELKGTGVGITVFCPGITQTEFRVRAGIREKRKNAGMTAQAAAHIAYVGTFRGKHIIIPGLLNRAFVCLSEFLPVGSVTSLVRFINRQRGHNQ